MNVLKSTWKWLSGKKAAIGSTLGCIAAWASSKGYLDQNDMVLVTGFLFIWTGIAVGHKLQKGATK